jgi:hypothetical protein
MSKPVLAIVASPMTYSVKGKQYVAIASQSVLFVFGLSEVSSESRRAIAGSEAVQKKYKLIQSSER